MHSVQPSPTFKSVFVATRGGLMAKPADARPDWRPGAEEQGGFLRGQEVHASRFDEGHQVVRTGAEGLLDHRFNEKGSFARFVQPDLKVNVLNVQTARGSSCARPRPSSSSGSSRSRLPLRITGAIARSRENRRAMSAVGRHHTRTTNGDESFRRALHQQMGTVAAKRWRTPRVQGVCDGQPPVARMGGGTWSKAYASRGYSDNPAPYDAESAYENVDHRNLTLEAMAPPNELKQQQQQRELMGDGGYRIHPARLKRMIEKILNERALPRVGGNGRFGAPSHEVLRQLFRHFDADKSDTIDKNEFVALCRARRSGPRGGLGLEDVRVQDLERVYDELDPLGKGLNYSELAQKMSSHFSDRDGIIDLPSTKDKVEAQLWTVEEAVHHLKQNLWERMDEFCTTPDEIFDSCKDPANGVITRNGLQRVMRGKFNIGIGHNKAMDHLFTQMDLDGNGVIDRDEFLTAFAPNERRRFKKMDVKEASRKHKGFNIGWKELHKIVVQRMRARSHRKGGLVGAAPNPHELQRIFRMIDTNHDGKLTLAEFKVLLHDHLHIINVSDADIMDLYQYYNKQYGFASDYRGLIGIFTENFSNSQSIIDFPSTLQAYDTAGGTRYPQAMRLLHDLNEKLISPVDGAPLSADQAFNALASASDGLIHRDHLKNVLRGRYGIGIGNDEAVEELFDEMDLDGDGIVTNAEFRRVLGALRSEQPDNDIIGNPGNVDCTASVPLPSRQHGVREWIEKARCMSSEERKKARMRRYAARQKDENSRTAVTQTRAAAAQVAPSVRQLIKRLRNRAEVLANKRFCSVNELLIDLFETYCHSPSGEMSQYDFRDVIKRGFGMLVPQQQFDAAFAAFDLDNNGTISAAEILKLLADEQVARARRISTIGLDGECKTDTVCKLPPKFLVENNRHTPPQTPAEVAMHLFEVAAALAPQSGGSLRALGSSSIRSDGINSRIAVEQVWDSVRLALRNKLEELVLLDDCERRSKKADKFRRTLPSSKHILGRRSGVTKALLISAMSPGGQLALRAHAPASLPSRAAVDAAFDLWARGADSIPTDTIVQVVYETVCKAESAKRHSRRQLLQQKLAARATLTARPRLQRE